VKKIHHYTKRDARYPKTATSAWPTPSIREDCAGR
jgi:hypothetical protein